MILPSMTRRTSFSKKSGWRNERGVATEARRMAGTEPGPANEMRSPQPPDPPDLQTLPKSTGARAPPIFGLCRPVWRGLAHHGFFGGGRCPLITARPAEGCEGGGEKAGRRVRQTAVFPGAGLGPQHAPLWTCSTVSLDCTVRQERSVAIQSSMTGQHVWHCMVGHIRTALKPHPSLPGT